MLHKSYLLRRKRILIVNMSNVRRKTNHKIEILKWATKKLLKSSTLSKTSCKWFQFYLWLQFGYITDDSGTSYIIIKLLKWSITIFFGAGSSAGIQVLQRVLAILDPLGTSHVFQYTPKGTITQILREKHIIYLPQTEQWTHKHQQILREREILTSCSLSVIIVANCSGNCWSKLDTYSESRSYLLLLKEQRR